MPLFGTPNDQEYEALVAENRFISDIQLAIEHSLEDYGITQSELGRRLNVSAARISQMLRGNGSNLTARTVAKIAHVIGLRACINLTEQYRGGWLLEEQSDDASDADIALVGYAYSDGAPEATFAITANDCWAGEPTEAAGSCLQKLEVA